MFCKGINVLCVLSRGFVDVKSVAPFCLDVWDFCSGSRILPLDMFISPMLEGASITAASHYFSRFC